MDLFSHLKKKLDFYEVDSLEEALFENESVHSLFINPFVISSSEFIKRFPLVKKHPFIQNVFYYPGSYELGKNFLFDVGAYYIQDASASLVPYFLDAKKDEVILDMCASPGGKTIFTALNMGKQGLLVANDTSAQRVLALSQNVERFGLANVIVTCNDLTNFINDYENYFDKVILDAPCSGSGMIRKERKMLDDWSESKVERLSLIQRKLLRNAVKYTKCGGYIIYSTCSFSYEENEAVILDILEDGNVKLVSLAPFEGSYSHQDLPGSLRLHPNRYHGEGHFICLLEKTARDIYYPKRRIQKNLKDKFPFPSAFDLSTLPYFYNYHGRIYGRTFNEELRFFNIVRAGIEIASKEEFGLVYHHALSHYLKDGVELSFSECEKYINGQEIELNVIDGYYLLKYEGFSFALTRVKNKRAKNLYPKGLRRNRLLI